MPDFKPMLASDAVLENIVFPVLASPKLDGIRATNVPGLGFVTRSLKQVPNANIQQLFNRPELAYLDGELIVGDPTAPDVFRSTTSVVMSHSKPAENATFYVFDHVQHPDATFSVRHELMQLMGWKYGADVRLVEQLLMANMDELLTYETEMLERGYEGVMIRSPHGRYKYGRSTAKEGILLKVKQFKDAEATIIGFVERMRNDNEATTNELGRTERSSHKANLVGRGDLGAFVVDFGGIRFQIGTGIGLDDYWRGYIFQNQAEFLGKTLTFKYLDVGVKDAPRHPVAKWTRSKEDMS